jgi:hypothetical protein
MKFASIIVLVAGLAALATPDAVAGNKPQTYNAVVDSDGTLARGRGATGVLHNNTGIYEVDFTKDVSACGYTASIGLSVTVGGSAPGTVAVVSRSGTPNGVYIQTFDNKGHASDLGFHLILSC